jgi:hemoglobin
VVVREDEWRAKATISSLDNVNGFDLYQAVGGAPMCRRLSAAFYARVQRDSVLRPFFPGKTLRCAIEQFAAFLAQLLGGPSEDVQARWWLSLRESHLRFKIGPLERAAWMKNMVEALNEVDLEESARTALLSLFERSSAYLVNAGEIPAVAPEAAERSNDTIDQEISRRWTAQVTLDHALEAVHRQDSSRAIALAERSILRTHFTTNRTVFAAFLAAMIASGDENQFDYVREKLIGDPPLQKERYSGRTLLHAAAAAGNLPIVELLLKLGSEPDTVDAGRHTPLYAVANECTANSGAAIVRMLVRAGGNVDAQDGVKHCTALHMAARRGNVAIAEALLDCGAHIEAKDSNGDTALRRAVNCHKTEVAALLLSRGADLQSKGSKGITPLMAVRTNAMRRLLVSGAEQDGATPSHKVDGSR